MWDYSSRPTEGRARSARGGERERGFPPLAGGGPGGLPRENFEKIEGLRCILAQSRAIIQVKTAFHEDGKKKKKNSSDVIFYSDFAKFCISY